MAAFDGILKCSIGSSSFQLRDYSYKESPIVEENLGRTGTKMRIEGQGWVEAATVAAFATALGDVCQGFRVDGFDVLVYGPSGILEAGILGGICIDGGPHIEFENAKKLQGDVAAPLVYEFKFVAEGESNYSPAQGGGTTSAITQWKVKYETRDDDITTTTYTGEINGAGAQAAFDANVRGWHGDPSVGNVWKDESECNVADDRLTFTVVVTNLVAPYPTAGGATIVDGEISKRIERDEQMRKITTYLFDVRFTGDPDSLMNALCPTVPPPILRRTCSYTNNKEQRLNASFTIIEGGDGSDLLDYHHTLEVDTEDSVWRAFEYANASPLIGSVPTPIFKITQRGRAVCVGGNYLKAPGPIMPNPWYSSRRPRIRYAPLNCVERETSWEYEFMSSTDIDTQVPTLLQQLERPSAPEYINVVPNQDATDGGG